MKQFIWILILLKSALSQEIETAIFAMGAFWSAEEAMEKVEGVISVENGYSGGNTTNPTYEQILDGSTGHYEVVKVEYNHTVITYKKLLYYFWNNIDPYDQGGQFCDRGSPYLSVIFYSQNQKQPAFEILKNIIKNNKKTKIATKLLPQMKFYKAEEYHQDYYLVSPQRYQYFNKTCKRIHTLNLTLTDFQKPMKTNPLADPSNMAIIVILFAIFVSVIFCLLCRAYNKQKYEVTNVEVLNEGSELSELQKPQQKQLSASSSLEMTMEKNLDIKGQIDTITLIEQQKMFYVGENEDFQDHLKKQKEFDNQLQLDNEVQNKKFQRLKKKKSMIKHQDQKLKEIEASMARQYLTNHWKKARIRMSVIFTGKEIKKAEEN